MPSYTRIPKSHEHLHEVVEQIMEMRKGDKLTLELSYMEHQLIKNFINGILPFSNTQWKYIKQNGSRGIYELHCIEAFKLPTNYFPLKNKQLNAQPP